MSNMYVMPLRKQMNNYPYPLMERSEPPRDQIHHLAGNNACQHEGRCQIGRNPISPKTLKVPER